MKKLLSLMTAMTLVATSSAGVISCGGTVEQSDVIKTGSFIDKGTNRQIQLIINTPSIDVNKLTIYKGLTPLTLKDKDFTYDKSTNTATLRYHAVYNERYYASYDGQEKVNIATGIIDPPKAKTIHLANAELAGYDIHLDTGFRNINKDLLKVLVNGATVANQDFTYDSINKIISLKNPLLFGYSCTLIYKSEAGFPVATDQISKPPSNSALDNDVKDYLTKLSNANNPFISDNNKDFDDSGLSSALYRNIAENVPYFSTVYNYEQVKLHVTSSFDYNKLTPGTADVNIKTLNGQQYDSKIFIADKMGGNLSKLKNSKSDKNHFNEFSLGDVSMHALFGRLFYDKANAPGKKWLDNTTFNYFLERYLDPYNEDGFASKIPTKIIPKDPTTGLTSPDDYYIHNADGHVGYIDSVVEDIKNQTMTDKGEFFDITKEFSFDPTQTGNQIVTTSVTELLEAMEPDIIHFKNYLLKTITADQTLDAGNFFAKLFAFWQTPVDDINADNFSSVDANDRTSSKLETNFDIMFYNVFDNWYSVGAGQDKPSYALIKKDGFLNYNVVNNDKTNNLDPKKDFRGAKVTISLSEKTKVDLGFPLLDMAFGHGYFEGVYESVVKSITSPSYTASSSIKIDMDIANLIHYPVYIPFSGVHEDEINQYMSNLLGISSNSINTKINGGLFEIDYTSDKFSEPKTLSGLSFDKVRNILKDPTTNGFVFKMKGILLDSKIDTLDDPNWGTRQPISMHFTKSNFNFELDI